MSTNNIENSTQCLPNNFTYVVFSTNFAFEESQLVCESIGGVIASIHSNEQNDLVFELVRQGQFNRNRIWIGLKDTTNSLDVESNVTGRFSWIDGSSFDFGTEPKTSPWLVTEPNNNFGDENCVQLLTDEGFWNDDSCDTPFGVLCQVPCEFSNNTLIEPDNSQLAIVVGAVGAIVVVVLVMAIFITLIYRNRQIKVQELDLKRLDTNLNSNDTKFRHLHRPSGLHLSYASTFLRTLNRRGRSTKSTLQIPLQSVDFPLTPLRVKSDDPPIQPFRKQSEALSSEI